MNLLFASLLSFTLLGMAIRPPIIPKHLWSDKAYNKEKVFVNSDSETIDKKEQTLQLYSLTKTHASCDELCDFLGRYEVYDQILDFVARSHYNPSDKMWSLYFSSSFLPTDFKLAFKMDRLAGEGDYFFTFLKGYFPGLRGKITVVEKKNHCEFQFRAWWRGPKTPFSSTVIELFTATLARVGVEKLMRKAKNPPLLFKVKK